MTKQSKYSPFGKMLFLMDKYVFEEEYMIESEVFDLLNISDDLFTYDSPLGMVFNEFKRLSSMEDDLFTYEMRVVKDFIFHWLDLKFGDHKNVNKEIIEEVVSTWLIRSYKKQFKEYTEIKRRLKVYGLYTDIECDASNLNFIE
nr:zf-BED domain-containing protein [Tanacetum cinerariifolium]